MLKALELVGFKSFADKTRLEFPPGITVVVGPNGSGKSNVVDAIKWVLGEQSVKSLRGKEMADCIFNGSAARRPMNAAETTLTFDNSRRTLALDTSEVHITRRVYRSGEGEYLINRQPCRLRDIRDLLAGTGIATEAYSVIEQGKVDVMLQASPRDRRVIFEEAAGISRFKTKKLEAERRLQRVDQNLLRLSDIVEEVDSRVKTVRLQAAKARRYKEYADRLQELRTQVGLADWRRLSDKLHAVESEAAAVEAQITEASRAAETVEAEIEAVDRRVAESDERSRMYDAHVAANRERIVAHEAATEHERRLMSDLEEEAARYRRQSGALSMRVGDLETQMRGAAEALTALEAQEREAARHAADEERNLTRFSAQLDELHAEGEQCRLAQLDTLKTSAALGKKISGLEAQVSAAKTTHERGRQRQLDLQQNQAALEAERKSLSTKLRGIESTAARLSAALVDARAEVAAAQQASAAAQQAVAELRERHLTAGERAQVLEELESRLEGVATGAQEVLRQARAQRGGPLRHVRGLVADLLGVRVEQAELIEIALGSAAEYLVVDRTDELLPWLLARPGELDGRATFVLHSPQGDVVPLGPKTSTDLRGRAGVVCRADELVTTPDGFAEVAERLLGNTWVVDSLETAVALAAQAEAGVRFVTPQGQLLTSEGMLSAGPRKASSGLILRRSELRALRKHLKELESSLEESGRTAAAQAAALAEAVENERVIAADQQRRSQELAEQRMRLAGADERAARLAEQEAQLEAELETAARQHAEAARMLGEARAEMARLEALSAELETKLSEATARTAQCERARQRQNREAGAARIELSRCAQQLEHLRMQRSQLERDQEERGRTLEDQHAQLARCLARSREASRSILSAETELAELYLKKELLAAEAANWSQVRQSLLAARGEHVAEAQRQRTKLRKHESKLHARQLVVAEARHERQTLADRLREDYGIELAELDGAAAPDETGERAAVDREIADLRSKLNSIGAVNLDALEELTQLEVRHSSLSEQHADLAAAKSSLENIIGRINSDSRKLFADTLDAVREHFQALFRKLFGGGHADIMLEDPDDVLESGIEIIARPPGKEPRNISLLSGGERTLTCVALLLALFRSRPSPFCVLDEVDAALDEANIERFVAVLHEFLTWTQFIVVTHSKKTMTCAHTLYGITMQESGVSKRVSVRFEDVSETGEIRSLPAADNAAPSAKDETQAA